MKESLKTRPQKILHPRRSYNWKSGFRW
jgi:hypothetical protein